MDLNHAPSMNESFAVQLNTLELLIKLGWTYLPPAQISALRQQHRDDVILRPILRQHLTARRFLHAGQQHPLTEKSIDHLINILAKPGLLQRLVDVNEEMYNHCLYGIAVSEFIHGKKVSPTIPIIDWQNPMQNSFHVCQEFTVPSKVGKSGRCDIVCFVNGLPWCVIEAKRAGQQNSGTPSLEAGIEQLLSYQRIDRIPQLFAHSQILIAIDNAEARYGTCQTPKKHFAIWREQQLTDDQQQHIKNTRLTPQQNEILFSHRSADERAQYLRLAEGGTRLVSQADQTIIGLLSPERLLKLTRFYNLFDTKKGRILARFHQMFGVECLLQRIETQRTDGGREGGVIWHTTGSGKSFTMLFVSKILLLHPKLSQCRLLMITDRNDLEDQLSRTFQSGDQLYGLKLNKAKATSGKALAHQLGKTNQRMIFSLIQKFDTAAKLQECFNDSRDIIVLVDEGHRSQGGANHQRMKQVLPNAAFVAFTGTPLLKDDATEQKFGSIIHAYPMQDAVRDGNVTPLLYEERIPEVTLEHQAIDRWFERVTCDLTDDQRADLKQKYNRNREVFEAKRRLAMIAFNVAIHLDNQVDPQLKGQLACQSKLAAVRYKHFFDQIGLFKSAIVMSPPDEPEGESDGEQGKKEVTEWWQANVGKTPEKAYTKAIIQEYEQADELRLLIVVDKLLTGFDEPRNSVLYIDKNLKSHNLIQAIARVNRLHPLKDFGYLIDYRGILKELDTSISKYQDLATRPLQGYNSGDIQNLYRAMDIEYRNLHRLLRDIESLFSGLQNRYDGEQYRKVLLPDRVRRGEELFDRNQKHREDFYRAVTAYSKCYKVAVQSEGYYLARDITEKDRARFKNAFRDYNLLRKQIAEESDEEVDYKKYQVQIRKLLDRHVRENRVRESGAQYQVASMGAQAPQQSPQDWSEQKLRNEANQIRSKLMRELDEMLDHPYAKKRFSEILEATIMAAEKQFDYPYKQYLLFVELQDQFEAQHLDEMPRALQGHRKAQSYFGIFKLQLSDLLDAPDQSAEAEWVAHARYVDDVVNAALQTYSISFSSGEAEIRKQLLPRFFAACQGYGGIQKANAIIEEIVKVAGVRMETNT